MANRNPWARLLELTLKWVPIAEVIKKAESDDTLASESDSAGADGKNKTTNNKKYKRNGN